VKMFCVFFLTEIITEKKYSSVSTFGIQHLHTTGYDPSGRHMRTGIVSLESCSTSELI